MKEIMLCRQDVEQITGLSRSSIYRLMDEGRFPPRFRLTDRRVGWRQSSIEKWIEDREMV